MQISMELSAFVDDDQIADRGRIKTGDPLVMRLIGQPIQGTLLELSSETKALTLTGVLECKFQGVAKVIHIDRGREGVHHEALLDCGVPLVLSHRASAPLQVRDVKGRIWSELGEPHIGKVLSGLALVSAEIAFAVPRLIRADVRARVRGLKRVNLGDAREEGLNEFEYRRDKIAGMVGLLIRVEVPGDD